jgi:hypothetical protein
MIYIPRTPKGSFKSPKLYEFHYFVDSKLFHMDLDS